jgi:DNA repair exonuclease SbcCD ATPase subunit
MGIVIERITIRNFQSYGDYLTELPLGSMGPSLVVGRLNGTASKSNGCGKTALTNAILWCLFGRLFDIKQPGDTIVNRQSGVNCMVRITTRDGWVITRTRKMDGANDLLVFHGTEDVSRSTSTEAQKHIIRHFGLDYDLFVSSVFFGQFSKPFLEMPDPQRKFALERLLNVHRLNAWAEVAKEKLELAETAHVRLKADVDAIASSVESYATQIEANKERLAAYEVERTASTKTLSDEIILLSTKIATMKTRDLPNLQEMQKKWDLLRQLRVKYDAAVAQITTLTSDINTVDISIKTKNAELQSARIRHAELLDINFPVIRADIHDANYKKSKKKDAESSINALKLQLRSLKQDADKIKTSIDDWSKKAGTTCITCKQQIDSTHITDMCAPTQAVLARAEDKIKTLAAQIVTEEASCSAIIIAEPGMSSAEVDRLEAEFKRITTIMTDGDASIVTLSNRLADLRSTDVAAKATRDKIALVMNQQKPPLLPDEINAKIKAIGDEEARAARLKSELDDKLKKPNPYAVVIADLTATIDSSSKRKTKLEDEMNVLYNKTVHYNYLAKAYGDRKKIKSVILSELIPFLNKRIAYYTGVFECPIKIGFTASLGVESNKWKYNLCSGGQKRRIDLSIAFALHDLHLAIYGRQCNIMLFDEVDSRLDSAGVEAFTNLILDDISSSHNGKPGPDSVIVVSHKDEMRDAFPSSIVVNMMKNNPDDEEEDGLSYAEFVTNQ